MSKLSEQTKMTAISGEDVVDDTYEEQSRSSSFWLRLFKSYDTSFLISLGL